MNWQDVGIVLSTQKLGEKSVILTLFTHANGLAKGVFKPTKRLSSLEPGNGVQATWKARLSEHLGTFYLEHHDTPLARILHQGEKVLFLKAVTHLLEKVLPEGQTYPALFLHVDTLLKTLHHRHDILYVYAQLEYILVHELGYGFDLSSCALCELQKELYYISPKSGRGACTSCGLPFKDKLFSYPWGLFAHDNAHTENCLPQKSLGQIHKSLKITGFFLSEYVIKQVRGSLTLPPIRDHFIKMSSQNVA